MARRTKTDDAPDTIEAMADAAPDPEETEQEYTRPPGFGGAAGGDTADEESPARLAGFGGEAKRLKRADSTDGDA